MEHKTVRQLRLSSGRNHLVLGAFERKVRVLNFQTGDLGNITETNFDFGGSRFSYSDTLQGFVTAAYHRYGVEFVDEKTGKIVWSRKDIKRPQRVSLSRDGRNAFIGFSDGPLQVLDLSTGATIEKMRGVSEAIESRDGTLVLVDSSRHVIRLFRDDSRLAFKRESFAVLDADLIAGKLAIAESGAGLRCFDSESGTFLWRNTPSPGRHFLNVGVHKDMIFALEWPYERGGAKEVVKFHVDNGTVVSRTSIGEIAEMIFVVEKDIGVLSDGRFLGLTEMKMGRLFEQECF